MLFNVIITPSLAGWHKLRLQSGHEVTWLKQILYISYSITFNPYCGSIIKIFVCVSLCPRGDLLRCSENHSLTVCDCRPPVFISRLLPNPPPFSLLRLYTDSSPLPGLQSSPRHTLHHSYLVPWHCANRRGQTLIYITKVFWLATLQFENFTYF